MSNERKISKNSSQYFEEKLIKLDRITPEDIDYANNHMLEEIEKLKKNNSVSFNLDNLEWDSTGEYDIKFGEFFRKEQEVSMVATPKTISRNPELKLLAKIICLEAISKQATDIQIMKVNSELGVVRFRIGEDFIPYRRLHGHSLDALSIVIKAMSNINVEEKGRGQGGRFGLTVANAHYDLRTSTIPTIQGENISIRVLYSKNLNDDLSKLGLPKLVLDKLRKVLILPEGLVLLTGGTGSGKTTTLYTCINEISRNTKGTKNIITLENPVEYSIAGVVQSPIDEARGHTFADGLKTILRQNPDIILVGEINDSSTAQTSVRASTSGHLVFSTLHTNDVLSVSTVMDYYEVPHFQLSWALQMVINQKLVNRLCPHCKIKANITTEENMWCKRTLGEDNNSILVMHKRNKEGCEHCSYHGYVGRVLVCSMLDANDQYTELAMRNPTLDVLEKELIDNGNGNYYPLKKDVYRHLRSGEIDMKTAQSITR